MAETQPSYRFIRPDEPLLAWALRQHGPVIVHPHDLAPLRQAGAKVETLPVGGPQPGHAWMAVEVSVEVQR